MDSGVEDFSGAEQWCRQVLSKEPRNHAAWNGLAWSYLRSGQPELALEAARRAHELNRHNAEYLNTLGVAHGEMGQFDVAEAVFRKALKLKPLLVEAAVNLAKVLEKQGRLPEARKGFERAYAIDPGFPKLALTLARLHRDSGDALRARQILERAHKEIDGQDLAMALAQCDFELDGEAKALERLRHAVLEHPEWILAHNALAHLLLSTAHWREGWEQYLWRNSMRGMRLAPQGSAPPERLDGQRVLLLGEQGIGDVLFFLRFAPLLRERGASITLACEKKLLSVVSPGDVLEAVRETREQALFDLEMPIGDLPALLECAETPPPWPLVLDEGHRRLARQQLSALGPGPYLGVTWRAGTDVLRGREFGNDPTALMKAVEPGLMGSALRGWPGTVIVLQRDTSPEDKAAFAAALGGPSGDLSALGDDLTALLGVLSLLDEYVCVSNTNVHLLAGIGATARVLVPYPGEWRWMRREGPSPWFPGFPVYREPQSRNWSEPLCALRADLFSGRLQVERLS